MRHWTTKLQGKSFYGSHMPILSIMGMGIYSTPLLDIMCHESKRPLVSYESDPVWFRENRGWESDYHKVNFVKNYDQADIENTQWSVVLIDNEPSMRRITDAKRLARHANFVLMHDSEPESNKFFKYTRIYPLFKYRFDYTRCRPNTTVLSNFVNLKTFFKNWPTRLKIK